MVLTYDVFDTVDQLPTYWNDLLPSDSGLRSEQLAIFEKASLNNLSYRYVVTRVNAQIALLSYYQLLSVTPEHFNCRDKPFQHYSLNTALRIVRPSLLVVGNLFRHDTEFQCCIAGRVAVHEEAAIFQQTFEYILNETKATGIFLKDVYAPWAAHIQKDPTYKQMEDDVSMVFRIPNEWTGLPDYEKQLKHKYLQRYRKIRNQLGTIHIREISEENLPQYVERIYALYAQVSDNQLVSMGKLNAPSFLAMKNTLKERYRIQGWFLEDTLVAFSSAILHEGIYDMNYIGFDYQINQSHAIYFNILFQCLEQAIQSGSHTLVLGRTALEAKAILGCEAEYQHGFYKLRHPVVNWFFKKVSAGFREQIGEKWKDRHPFKSQFYEQQKLRQAAEPELRVI